MKKIVMPIAGAGMFIVLSMTHWPAALAQMPFPMGPPGGGGQPGFPFPMGPGQVPGGGMGMGMLCPIDYVKSTLGITDAQKGVWDSYAALKTNLRPRLRRRARLQSSSSMRRSSIPKIA